MTISTQRRALPALAVLCLSLAACGGGSDAADSTTPAAPANTPPAVGPITITAYTPDLTSFAIAWTSLQIAETAFDVLHISGETGPCGVAGSTAYDVGAVRQTLSQCVTHTSADNGYTGGWSATITRSGTTKTVTMSSPSLVVTDPAAPTEPQLAITAGDLSGVDDFSNDTLDAYTGVGFSLDAHIGASANTYHIGSSSGATASQAYQNGVATLSIASAAVGVNYAGNAWKFTVLGLRAVADQRPDQGTLVVADQSQPSTAATTVTFGAGNVLQFASGGLTVMKSWNDADLQAALAVAKQ